MVLGGLEPRKVKRSHDATPPALPPPLAGSQEALSAQENKYIVQWDYMFFIISSPTQFAEWPAASLRANLAL